MRFKSVISKPELMDEAAARAFMDSRKAEEYQLVDVRLHEEYEEEHLPGARLIPLDELTAGMADLNPAKPTIVYCRSGNRSQAAAQWLVGQGFVEVYDIGFHIRDWLGIQATGEYEADLNLIVPTMDYDGVWELAYAMEEGLQRFYLALADREQDPDLKKIYSKLAGYEDLHKERLLGSYAEQTGKEPNPNELKKKYEDVLEGGEIAKQSPFEVVSKIQSVPDIFGLSMGIEAQSQDLYMRLSRKSERKDSRKLLEEMADEEKQHLAYISKELKRYLRAE